jgi:uncharacterized membrane protein
MRVLLAGESWVTHSVHVKGVDSFTTSSYVEGAGGVPEDWPALLGYNQLTARSDAQVLVRCDADPLLTVGSHGAGRSAAFASDCAPHWCPPGFMAWPGYDPLWGNLIHWLAGQR